MSRTSLLSPLLNCPWLLFLGSLFVLASPLGAQTHFWNHSNSGIWSNAAEWTPASVPNAATHWAQMSVSSGTPYTINMDMDVLLDQLDLTAGNALLQAIGRTVQVNTRTQIGPGGGTHLVLAGTTWTGAGSFTNEALLDAQGLATIENLIQKGKLRILGDNVYGNSTLTLIGNALNTGDLELVSQVSGYTDRLVMDGSSILSNAGTFQTQVGSGGNRIFDGAMVNTGNVLLDFDTTMSRGPIEHNLGLWRIGPTTTLTVPTGTVFRQGGGVLENQGVMDLVAATYEFNGGTVTTNPVRLLTSTLAVSPVHTDPGLFQLEGTSSFSGNLWPGQEVTVSGNGHGGNAATTVTTSTSNAGVWRLTTKDSAYATTLVQSPGTQFQNHGALDFQIGSAGSRSFDGDLFNAQSGTLTVSQDTIFRSGPVLNFGAWTVDPGATARVDNGVTFTHQDGVLDVQGEFLHDSGVDYWIGGTTLGTPKLTNSQLHLNGTDNAPFTLLLRGSSTLTGDVGSQGSLVIRGDNYGSNATLTTTAATISRGQLTLDTAVSGYAVHVDTQGGALDNQGMLQVLPGTTGSRLWSGDLTNSGTTDIQYPITFQSGVVRNQGQWTIQPNQLMSLTATSTLEQTAGTLDVQGQLHHVGGIDRLLGGNINGEPQFINSALEFGPGFTDPFTGAIGGLSTLKGAPASGQTLTLRGDSLGVHPTLSLVESVTNEGTLDIVSEGAAYQDTLDTNGFTFTNAGTLRTLQGANGSRTLRGSLHNTGTLDFGYTTGLQIGPVVNSGQWVVQPGFTTTLNAGIDFTMDGGNLDVQGELIQLLGSTHLLGGTVTGSPRFRTCALDFGPGFSTAIPLRIEGTSTLAGPVPSGAKLWLAGNSGGSHASLNLTAPVILGGSLELRSENAAFQVLLQALGGNDLTVSGSMLIAEGSGGARTLRGGFHNQGTIAIEDDTVVETGPFDNLGILQVASGHELRLASLAFSHGAGALQLDGDLLVQGGTATFAGGTIQGVPLLRATSTVLDAGFTAPGTLQLEGNGSLQGMVKTGQALRQVGNSGGSHTTITAASGLTNAGNYQMTTENAAYTVKLVVQGGDLVNEGAIEVLQGAAGNRIIEAVLDNRGSVDLYRATTLGVLGADHRNDGTLATHSGDLTLVGNSFTNLANGLVSGVGTWQSAGLGGTVVNEGRWAPGLSAGWMTVSGDWTQTASGSLQIEIGGYVAGSEYDRLQINGTAQLGGEVVISTLGGFEPRFGDQFTILTAGSIQGSFDGVRFLGSGNLAHGFDLIHTPTEVIAQVVNRVGWIGSDPSEITLSEPVPGVAGQTNHFQVDGATGNGNVIVAWGLAAGTTPAPGCPGLDFALANAQQGGTAQAGVHGTAVVAVSVPGAASGVNVLFQALDLATCRLSPVVHFVFP